MNRHEIYNSITAKIMDKLNTGIIPWRRSWSIGIPHNYVSSRPYNGINFLSLISNDDPAPGYLTFLQAKELGAQINKGASGRLIVFWKMLDIESSKKDSSAAKIPLLRYSYVFNLSQTSLYNDKSNSCQIVSAEELISQMQLPAIKNNYRRCAYSLTDDYITLPKITDFESAAEYYSAFFMKLSTQPGIMLA